MLTVTIYDISFPIKQIPIQAMLSNHKMLVAYICEIFFFSSKTRFIKLGENVAEEKEMTDISIFSLIGVKKATNFVLVANVTSTSVRTESIKSRLWQRHPEDRIYWKRQADKK